MDCACARCAMCCESRRGWFAYGEMARTAEALGLTERELFQQSLAVDYFYEDGDVDRPIFVLIPNATQLPAGQELPFDPRGRCVFYQTDGRCGIHATKPAECRFFDHDKTPEELMAHRLALVEEWKAHHESIVWLLGREPRIRRPHAADVLIFQANNAQYEQFRQTPPRAGEARREHR